MKEKSYIEKIYAIMKILLWITKDLNMNKLDKRKQLMEILDKYFSQKEKTFFEYLELKDDYLDAILEKLAKIIRLKIILKSGNLLAWKKIKENDEKEFGILLKEIEDYKKISAIRKKLAI